VNSADQEDFPLVSPSGRELFFSRFRKDDSGERCDIYRLDARLLDALKKGK
jgi:hypothetical protein